MSISSRDDPDYCLNPLLWIVHPLMSKPVYVPLPHEFKSPLLSTVTFVRSRQGIPRITSNMHLAPMGSKNNVCVPSAAIEHTICSLVLRSRALNHIKAQSGRIVYPMSRQIVSPTQAWDHLARLDSRSIKDNPFVNTSGSMISAHPEH